MLWRQKSDIYKRSVFRQRSRQAAGKRVLSVQVEVYKYDRQENNRKEQSQQQPTVAGYTSRVKLSGSEAKQ